ncbi:MAG TPA: LacI family DNA-binding transcriptional regulator, partial [Pilimelia sp.]|nr:LacI family DNA-binding transcriptional regulator [Pilimelia sp.]
MSRSGPASTGAQERVRAAAARLGYAPDPLARALASRAGFRLVIAVQGGSDAVLDDPYVDRVVRAAVDVAGPQGVGVSLQRVPVAGRDRLDALARDRGVRGVLLVNTTEDLLAAVPGALRGRAASIGVGARGVPSFDVDNAGGTTAVLRHLYAAGRRRIVLVTGPRWLPCTRRPVVAYRALMAAAGLPARLVPGDFTAASGRAAVPVVLERWPDTDAIVGSTDATALGVLGALRERGVRVPGDIAVAGFDDIPFAALSAPALTTASHHVRRMSAAVASPLLDGTRVPPETAYPSVLIAR